MTRSLRKLIDAMMTDDPMRLLADPVTAEDRMRSLMDAFQSRIQGASKSSKERFPMNPPEGGLVQYHNDAIIRTLEGIARFLCPDKPFDPKTMRVLIKAGLPARKLPRIGWVARAGDLREWCRMTLDKVP